MKQSGTGEAWGSRIGIILAVMGSAIGLGNFLRFPGLAAKYEGGTFMIPYFVAFLLLGLPIAWAEWSLGRYGGRKGFNSSPGIFRAIWPSTASPYMGLLGLLVPVCIYMYYVFIEAWCLYYAYQYLVGMFASGGGLDLGKDPGAYKAFFAGFTGMSGDGVLFRDGLGPAVIALLICFALNFAIIYRGLARGIELVSKIAIPILLVCAVIILIRVLTLGTPDPAEPDRNVLNGLGFMWNPRTDGKSLLESLSNAQMWLEAAGQIFFSLSVGFGIIITYASYLKKDDDVILSGTTAASGNIFAEVALGGLITIPAAFIFLGASGTGGGTLSLGFMTLPNVFAYMPLGGFFGFLWFFLLFLAAITSSLSMLQPAIAFLEEGLGTSRRASVTLLSMVTLFGSLFIVFFSGDLMALDTMDFWIGSFCIYILATIEVILFGWIFGVERGLNEARKGALLPIPSFAGFIIKYISPASLLIIFAAWSYQKVPGYLQSLGDNHVARYTLYFIMLMALFFLFLIFAAVSRWKKLETQAAGGNS